MTDDYTPTTEEVRGTYIAYSFRDCFEKPGPTQPKGEWGAEFDRWLSAHDAEVRAAEMSDWAQTVLDAGKQGERIGRASVLAEQGEPEWEYGVEYEATSTESVFTAAHSEAMARKWVEESPTDTGLRRRRPAGPWEPVEENTEALTEGSER